MESTAVDISVTRQSSAADVLKPPRSRKKDLTTVDRRTRVFRRIAELTALFTSALTQAGLELSPVRKLKVQTAAEAVAVAELARGKYMRDGDGDLTELLTAERRADAAMKGLGLPDRSTPKEPTLADILAGPRQTRAEIEAELAAEEGKP